jgi:hypothetical protein
LSGGVLLWLTPHWSSLLSFKVGAGAMAVVANLFCISLVRRR